MSGILPYLQQLHPDLQGSVLVTQSAESIGVHFTTVYKWLRHGMASAESQHLLRLAALLQAKGRAVDFDDLRNMCRMASEPTATETPEAL